MEFLVVLLVLAVVGGPIVAGLIGVSLAGAERSGRARAIAGADATIAKLFAGGAQTVTYDSRPYDSLEATPVIQGAVGHGYRLVSNDGGLLLFERA